jgi:hypothetical protein
MAQPEHLQVTYLPYLSMHERKEIELKPLNVKVWNFKEMASTYVSDPVILASLTALMHTNVRNRQPIEDMGIISVGLNDFRLFNEDERAIANEARMILFLRSLAKTGVLKRGINVGHLMHTSENFQMVHQNFVPGSEWMGVQDGFIVPKTMGGLRISRQKFSEPLHALHPPLNGDSKLVSGLLRARRLKPSLYKRIIRASQPVLDAYYNDINVSQSSRILTLATAYEILFELPESAQRQALKDVFKFWVNETNDPKLRYKSPRRPGSPGVWEAETVKVMWADRFYLLRNAIIHGSRIKPRDYYFRGKQRYIDIAIIFFVYAVKKMLEPLPGSGSPYLDSIKWEKHKEFPDDDFEHEGFLYDDGGFKLLHWEILTKLDRTKR